MSSESKNMAYFLAGMLSSSGYAKMFMVGQTEDGSPGDISHERIAYVPAKSNGKKIVEVPGSDVTFGHWACLTECQVLIITVNTKDTEACCTKLADVMHDKKWVSIFSLQRGVRNSSTVSHE